MTLIGTIEEERAVAQHQKLQAALSAAERLFRSAADELASARHEMSEGNVHVADRSLKESAKLAADALSILQLLPDVTGALRPISQPSTLTSQPVPNA